MKLFLKILKTGLVVSLLILAGQIPVGPRTVGGHLAHSLYLGIVWVGDSLREAEWFAKMSESPKEKRRESRAEGPKDNRVAVASREDFEKSDVLERAKSSVPSKEVEKEKISPEDQESLVNLLQETN